MRSARHVVCRDVTDPPLRQLRPHRARPGGRGSAHGRGAPLARAAPEAGSLCRTRPVTLRAELRRAALAQLLRVTPRAVATQTWLARALGVMQATISRGSSSPVRSARSTRSARPGTPRRRPDRRQARSPPGGTFHPPNVGHFNPALTAAAAAHDVSDAAGQRIRGFTPVCSRPRVRAA